MATATQRILDAVLACAQEALGEPVPGRVLHVPGTSAVWDDCCDGQLWVRLTGLTPLRQGAICLGYNGTVEVGIIRCVAVVDEQGVAPSPARITADAVQVYDDMTALMAGLTCCEWVKTMIEWQPLGLQGGCGGGAWTVRVSIPNCDDC